jgi:receptor expression-enhancing protein 5/6
LDDFPTLKSLESQSGVPKVYGVLGASSVYFLLIFINVGGIGQLLANFACLMVPGYYSLMALETKSTADDTHYLTYWVVYAAFSVVEFWSKAILYWIPFYWVFKTFLFLYLGLPHYNGARWVYTNVLRPVSVKFLGISGGSSSSLKEKVSSAAKAAEGAGSSTGVEHAKSA